MRTFVLVMIDFVVLVLTLVLAFKVIGRSGFPDSIDDLIPIGLFASGIVAVFLAMGIYHRSWRFFSFSHAMQLSLLCVPSFIVDWALIFFAFPSVQAERGHIPNIALAQGLFSLTAFLIARGLRRALREQMSNAARKNLLDTRSRHLRQALLVGSPDWVLSVIGMLKREATTGCL